MENILTRLDKERESYVRRSPRRTDASALAQELKLKVSRESKEGKRRSRKNSESIETN